MDDPLSWKEDTFQLHAMINLLSLRSGGQLDTSIVEHSEDSEKDAYEDDDEEEDDILSEGVS